MHYHFLLVSALLLYLAQASYRNVNDVTETVTEKETVTDKETVTKTVTNEHTNSESFTTISWSTTITPTTYTPSGGSSELSETKIDTQKSDGSHIGSTTSIEPITSTSSNDPSSSTSSSSGSSLSSSSTASSISSSSASSSTSPTASSSSSIPTSASSTASSSSSGSSQSSAASSSISEQDPSSVTSAGLTTSASSTTSTSSISTASSTISGGSSITSTSSPNFASSTTSTSSTSTKSSISSDSSTNPSSSSVSTDSAFYTSFTISGSLLTGLAISNSMTISGSLVTSWILIPDSTPNPISSSFSSNTASSGDPTIGSPTTASSVLSSSSSLDSSSTFLSSMSSGSVPTSTNSNLESSTYEISTSTSVTVTIPTPPDSMISSTSPASTNSRSAATSSTVASSTTSWSTNLSSLRDALTSAGWVLPSTFSGYPSVDTFRSSSTFDRSLTTGSTSTMSASASSPLADSSSSVSTTSLNSEYGATSFSSPTRSGRASSSSMTSTDVSLPGADSSISRSSPSATDPAAMSTASTSRPSSTGSAVASISSGSPSSSSAGACLTADEKERLNELKKKLKETNLTYEELNELARLDHKAEDCETEEEEALHDLRLNAALYREYDVQKFLGEKLAEFEDLPVGDKDNYKKHDGLDFSFASWLFHKHTKASPDTTFCDGKRLCSYTDTLNIVKTGDARVDAQILLALQSITVWSGHAKDFIDSFNDAFNYAIATTDEMVRDLSIFKETQQRVEHRENMIKTIFNIVLFGALQATTIAGATGDKGAGLLFGSIANGVVLANSLYGVWRDGAKDPTEDVAADLKFEMSRLFNATHHYFQTESANILGGKKNADGTYMFLNIMQQPAILEWFSSNVDEDYTEPIKKGVMSRLVHGILGELQEASIMAVWLPVHCESPGHWSYKMCFNDDDYWRMPEDPICFSGYGNIGFTLRWKYMMDNKKYDRDYMPGNVTKKLSKYETSLDDIVRASLAWRATHGETPLLDAGAGNITDIMRPDELSVAQREFAGPLYGQVAFRIEDHTSEHLANQVLPAPWSSIASPEHGEHKDNCRREACKIKYLRKKKYGKIEPDAPIPACATDDEHCHDNC